MFISWGVVVVVGFMALTWTWYRYKYLNNGDKKATKEVQTQTEIRVEQRKKIGDVEAEVLRWNDPWSQLDYRVLETGEEKSLEVDIFKIAVIVSLANGKETPVVRRSLFDKAFCVGDKILIQVDNNKIIRIRNVGPRKCGL